MKSENHLWPVYWVVAEGMTGVSFRRLPWPIYTLNSFPWPIYTLAYIYFRCAPPLAYLYFKILAYLYFPLAYLYFKNLVVRLPCPIYTLKWPIYTLNNKFFNLVVNQCVPLNTGCRSIP